MNVYLMQHSVEGRTKLYLATIKTSDTVLAELTVKKTKVDLTDALSCFPFAYPKKPLKIFDCPSLDRTEHILNSLKNAKPELLQNGGEKHD